MQEPNNPDAFYFLVMRGEKDGKTGRLKIKKWPDPDTGKIMERLISFEEDNREVGDGH